MPTSPFGFRRRTFGQQAAALGAALVVESIAFGLLYRVNTSMAWGVAAGGGLVLLFGLFALLRRGRGVGSSSFERGMGGAADERDKALMTQTFAVGGISGLFFMAANLVALALGAPALIASAVMMWATLLAMAVGYFVNSRRM